MPESDKPRGTAVRKRPQQARSLETVDFILSAAARLLEQEGYDGANTNRIAETAGISVGSLYQYFPSKDAVLAELFEREHRRYLEAVDAQLAASATAPFEEAVRAMVRATGELYTKQRLLLRTLAERISDSVSFNRCHELRSALIAVLKRHIDLHRADRVAGSVDSGLLAFVLGNSISGMYSALLIAPPGARVPNVDVIENELVKMVSAYLGSQCQPNFEGCPASQLNNSPEPLASDV